MLSVSSDESFNFHVPSCTVPNSLMLQQLGTLWRNSSLVYPTGSGFEDFAFRWSLTICNSQDNFHSQRKHLPQKSGSPWVDGLGKYNLQIGVLKKPLQISEATIHRLSFRGLRRWLPALSGWQLKTLHPRARRDQISVLRIYTWFSLPFLQCVWNPLYTYFHYINKSPNQTKDETPPKKSLQQRHLQLSIPPSRLLSPSLGGGRTPKASIPSGSGVRLNMSGHSNSQNLMDKYLLLDPSGKDFTKNRLGKFNLFGRITQANDCIAILFVRQLSSSSGHPESASPKGRVKIPRSFMVNGNMDTTPHFIGWSMHQNHQISEVQKHNLTSISTQKRTTTTHSHHIVPFQSVPLFSCWVVLHVPFFSGHSNTSWCILVFCLCVFVMLCLLYLIWLYLVRFNPCGPAGSVINEAAEVMVVLGIKGTAAWIHGKTPDYQATRWWVSMQCS